MWCGPPCHYTCACSGLCFLPRHLVMPGLTASHSNRFEVSLGNQQRQLVLVCWIVQIYCRAEKCWEDVRTDSGLESFSSWACPIFSFNKLTNSLICVIGDVVPRFYQDLERHIVLRYTRFGTLIVTTIYLQLIQNRYMFRSFTVLQCSHQHCVQPVASDVEVVGYL